MTIHNHMLTLTIMHIVRNKHKFMTIHHHMRMPIAMHTMLSGIATSLLLSLK